MRDLLDEAWQGLKVAGPGLLIVILVVVGGALGWCGCGGEDGAGCSESWDQCNDGICVQGASPQPECHALCGPTLPACPGDGEICGPHVVCPNISQSCASADMLGICLVGGGWSCEVQMPPRPAFSGAWCSR